MWTVFTVVDDVMVEKGEEYPLWYFQTNNVLFPATQIWRLLRLLECRLKCEHRWITTEGRFGTALRYYVSSVGSFRCFKRCISKLFLIEVNTNTENVRPQRCRGRENGDDLRPKSLFWIFLSIQNISTLKHARTLIANFVKRSRFF